MQILAEEGIDTRPFFLPLHTLPPFREESRRRGEHLPITDGLSQAGMNLPTYFDLSNDNILKISQVIRSYSDNH
jgi:perosamine synthetase